MDQSEPSRVKYHPDTKLPIWHLGLYENEGENKAFVKEVEFIFEKEKTKKQGNEKILDYSIFFKDIPRKSLFGLGVDPNSYPGDLFVHLKTWKNFRYRDSLRFPHKILKGHCWIRGGGPIRKTIITEGACDIPDDGEEDIDPNEEEREEIEVVIVETKETKAVPIEPPINRPTTSLPDGLSVVEIGRILNEAKRKFLEIPGNAVPEHFGDMEKETIVVVENLKTQLKRLHSTPTFNLAFVFESLAMLKEVVTNFKIVSSKKKEIELAKLSLKESLKTFKTLENQAQKSSESVSTLSHLEKNFQGCTKR